MARIRCIPVFVYAVARSNWALRNRLSGYLSHTTHWMQRPVYTFFLFLFSLSAYSQDIASQLIGRWELIHLDFVGEMPQEAITWSQQPVTKKVNWWFFANGEFKSSASDQAFSSLKSVFKVTDSTLVVKVEDSRVKFVIEKLSADSLQVLQVNYSIDTTLKAKYEENVIFWRYSLARQPIDTMPDSNRLKPRVQLPEFPGGTDGLMRFLGKNMRYPQAALRSKAKGMVLVLFTVSETGEIVDGAIMKSPRVDFALEVIRVCKHMPRWTPGQKDGESVPVKYILPVKFKF